MSHFVYIRSNRSHTLYTGVTNDLRRRMHEHETRVKGFTSRHRFTRLVYYEAVDDLQSAMAREREFKGWVRKKKVELIQAMNPYWKDLSKSLAGKR